MKPKIGKTERKMLEDLEEEKRIYDETRSLTDSENVVFAREEDWEQEDS